MVGFAPTRIRPSDIEAPNPEKNVTWSGWRFVPPPYGRDKARPNDTRSLKQGRSVTWSDSSRPASDQVTSRPQIWRRMSLGRAHASGRVSLAPSFAPFAERLSAVKGPPRNNLAKLARRAQARVANGGGRRTCRNSRPITTATCATRVCQMAKLFLGGS